MSAPLISVVIPAYNHEQFIGAGIESVLNQTVDDLELIIVDDGSTDKTAEVIKSYDDPRISYTWQENQDAFNTINRGMGMATGEYISILNSDDVYTTDRFEKLLAYAKDKKVDCLFTDVIPISDSGEEFTDPDFGWNVWHRKNRNYYHQHNDIYTGFLNGNYMVTTSNLFMSKVAVDKVGKFSSLRYLHDYDYIFRLMLAFPESVFYVDDQQLLYYRIHSGNTLSEAAIMGREQDLQVIQTYMLEKIPTAYRQYVQTGCDRLRQLDGEILDVQAQLGLSKIPGHAKRGPLRRIAGKVKRTVFGPRNSS
ncbi:MAG: glycosyltransferase [Gammaproteobacteria bacterium]|nr:glycosyltransferase [Gammaproteobacteria bacterium]